MRIDTAIVIYKKSHYQIYTANDRDPSVIKRIKGSSAAAKGLKSSHAKQAKSIELVRTALAKLNIETVWRWRSDRKKLPKADIIISVGGDGTVLDAARKIKDSTPVLGVNSDPSWSVGRLCAVASNELKATIAQLREDVIRPTSLTRVGFRVVDLTTGEVKSKLYGPYLNELLYAHPSPADTSRFHLDFGICDLGQYGPSKSVPLIRSSGLWIAAAAGSSAAIKSAGGRIVALSNKRLQYLIREPYIPTHEQSSISQSLSRPRLKHAHSYPSVRGMVKLGDALYVTSRMRRARMWGDGFLVNRVFNFGETLQVFQHPDSLELII